MGCRVQVEDWLRQNELERFAKQFLEHEISVDILATLTEEDLREIGLPLGARKRFLNAIKKTSGNEAQNGIGERRQVTVLFCDLVDYTGLATRLDPEDLEDLMGQVVNVCRRDVAQWGGHVGNYLGDGILVYFGWPQAYEDAPERAAHAAHHLIKEVAELTGPDGTPLAMRVGMATGLVLIGHRIEAGRGEVETVYGETPNLAARLETLAQPGQVLMDEATASLLPERLFGRSDLGETTLKGFSDPVTVWRLDQAQTTARTQGAQQTGVSGGALQGRAAPLAHLDALWSEASSGQGMRMVMLSGEAGMGKSHLIAHFQRRCVKAGGRIFELQCWPYNDHATLYPVVACLNARAGVLAGTPEHDRRDAFARLAAANGLGREFYEEQMGDLLDLCPPPVRRTEDMRRTAWFHGMAEDLCALTRHAPVLWVLEDLHWSDPVTLNLLEHLRVVCSECRIMVVATCRPHFEPPWSGEEGVCRIDLERVDREAAEQIVDDLVGDRELGKETRARILAASDGVPLFVHELTREVLERAGSVDDEAHLTIPATLQGVLSSRLDTAQEAKPLAQVASCIGRVFSLDVLQSVAGRRPAQIKAQLDTLEALALIERLDSDNPSYIFRHALIQEAAYQSQPKARRRKVHGAIGDTLASREGADALQVANHMTAAERFDDAVTWWRRAGDRAARRSAQREAAGLYRRALELLDRSPDQGTHDARRLAISLALGPVLSASDGYGAESVGALYAQAAELSDAVGRPGDRFAVRRGLWLYRQMSAQYPGAEQAAQDMLSLAGAEGSKAAQLEADRALGATAFMLGKLTLARHHLEAALQGYAAGVGADHVLRYGDDPGLASMAYLSSTLWYLGDPDAASACCDDMLAKAREIKHPFSSARSLTFSAYTFHLMRDFDRLMDVAEEAARHADKYEFPFHAGVGRILWGWGMCQIGDCDRGWPVIEQGYEQYAASGSHMLQPLYLSLMAEIVERRGDRDRARHLSDQALTRIEASQEALVLPEVLRINGELAGRRGETDDALPQIKRAIGLARAQDSRFCLIRALTSAMSLDVSHAAELEAELVRFKPTVKSADLDAARAALL